MICQSVKGVIPIASPEAMDNRIKQYESGDEPWVYQGQINSDNKTVSILGT